MILYNLSDNPRCFVCQKSYQVELAAMIRCGCGIIAGMGTALLIFILAPLLEIYVLIQVGGEIGALTTIVLILATAALGVLIIKYQGVRVLGQLQAELRSGRSPGISMWHTLLLALAGVLLLTPGFVTDSVGGLLLVPAFRIALLRSLIRRWMQKKFSRRVTIVEGEFKVLD